VSYRVLDDLGQETFLPLLSDWDLDAAFLGACDPSLHLLVFNFFKLTNKIINIIKLK
jgi:hypothetical protein